MSNSRGDLPRTLRGFSTPNNSDRRQRRRQFIQRWAQRYSAKEGAAKADMTPKGFQKLQSGENAISYDNLCNWMGSDTEFAAAYAAEMGLILPGQAESAAALTKAVNAYLQGAA